MRKGKTGKEMETDIHQSEETEAQGDREPSAEEGREESAGLGRRPLGLTGEDPAIKISFNIAHPH